MFYRARYPRTSVNIFMAMPEQQPGILFLPLAEGMSIDDADDYAFNRT